MVCPPAEVGEAGAVKWKQCVVGYFLDRKLPFLTVKSIAAKIWAKFGLTEVLSNDQGFSFFQFDNYKPFKKINHSGPRHFGGRLMVLKQWVP